MAKGKPKVGKNSTPAADRTPRALAVDGDGRHQHPLFSFAWMDRHFQGEWGWHMVPDHAEAVFEFIQQVSQKTWNEIWAELVPGKGGQHRKHHWEPIEGLCDAAKTRLAQLQLDVASEDIFRFRLTPTQRLWGFEIGGVFMAVWWDPDHRVHPL